MYKNLSAICLFVSAIAIHSVHCTAEDIATDVKNGNRSNQDGGFLELGLLTGYMNNPFHLKAKSEMEDTVIDLDASFVYRKSGFFAEAVFATQDGVNLGYNFWQNENWSVDLLAGSLSGSYDFDFKDEPRAANEEEQRNKELYHRNTFHTGTGVRVTRYIHDYVVQYRLVTDVLDDNGVISTLRLGRAWQYRNWSVHAILSAIYTSKETNQYWFGVKQSQSTPQNPPFYPEASLSYSAVFGVTRPINEKWVFRGIAGWEETPDEIKPSTFVDDKDRSYLGVSVSRVFWN
ncbi:Outer membrane protein OmpV [Thalassocella blandensis]|nr:Outer membrane protein OmpV [Thalassocella blandensis]